MSKLLTKVLATVACLAALVGCRPEQAPDRSRCLEEGLGELVETRWVEPRLSGGFAWEQCEERPAGKRLLGEVICPASHNATPAVSRSSEACDEPGKQHLKALEQVARQSNLDGAIMILTALAEKQPDDAQVRSDLAGAFLVRARRQDRPSDLLRAVREARRAVARPDPSPEALFNLALAQETLQLPTRAAATWAVYLETPDDPQWSAAGRRRRDRLERQGLRAAAMVWRLNQLRLPDVIRLGDREAVAQLVAPFPGAAHRYVEEEVLPAWARMTEAGDPQAPQRLIEAREIASAMLRATGDRYLSDVVEVVETADRRRDAATLHALGAGHIILGEARQLSRERGREEEERYRQAAAALGAAGSPLRIAAEVGVAAARSRRLREGDCAQALAILDPLERSVRRRGYASLLARLIWVRALCLAAEGRFPDALAAYAESLAIYRRLQDREGAANIRARMAGVARDLGQRDLAWEYAWRALRDIDLVVEPERRHYVLGEAAEAALGLDEPETALLFQTDAIDRLLEDLSPRPQDDPLAAQLSQNLAIARRARAPVLALLGRQDLAEADVQEALRLSENTTNEDVRRALLARAREVEARTLLRSQPRAAIRLLTEAIRLYPRDQFRTYRANLHFLLARAYRRTGDSAGAEEALKAGMEEIRAEEERILALRRPGDGEAFWAAYFSRFGKAYQQLVRLLTEQEKHAEAFAYAERSRAFEPLDLVLRGSTPREFERLAAQRETLGLADVQKSLPAGTFLFDYYLLDRDEMDAAQLVVWVVWREGFEVLRSPVARPTLQRWAEVLHAAQEAGGRERFIDVLEAAFTALLEAPLELLARLDREGTKVERLVFVPDGAMHALPLAALRDPATNRHLIERYTVAIAPSATLHVYSLLRDRELPAEPASALIVGDPAFDAKLDVARDLQRLPAAAQEIRGVRPLYPRADVLPEEQATVEEFLRRGADKTVIHFAGHAVANPEAPSRSLLLLARSPDHSGALTAEELVRDLKLRKTRLVVLSACSTAGGKSIGPSGLAPLVRPFLAAGVPAVVGTLWNVKDVVPANLLVSFHRYLAAGEDAADAMRRVQLDFLNQPGGRTDRVLVWAPFQVVGHASSPFPPN